MKLALFDIDGVLADDRHRVQHALDQQWLQYFDKRKVFADGVWHQGRDLVQEQADQDWTIGYLTGRREDLRWTTTAWLAAHGFPVGVDNLLLMRDFQKGIPLANFKLTAMQSLVSAEEFEEVILFDDDPEVIRLVQEKMGPQFAHHCTWHIKEKALVKSAKA